MSKNTLAPAAQKHGNKRGVSSMHLKAYWKWIWSFRGPTKYILFRWLLLHATLPVDQSLKGDVATILRQCCYCGDMQETTKHALWSYSLAHHVWNKVPSLFLTINGGCRFPWGSTIWGFSIPVSFCQNKVRN